MDVILYMKIESNKVHPISASFVKLFVCKFKKKQAFTAAKICSLFAVVFGKMAKFFLD